MRKLGFILGFIILTLMVKAQVKNENGIYTDSEGNPFTGICNTEEKGIKKATITVKNGQANGEAQYYYASGKVMETGMFEKGQKTGKWTRFNESGIIIGIASYNLGKKDGTWVVFDDNGKKRFEMNYINGEKTGVWYNWNENGDLVSSKDYSQVN